MRITSVLLRGVPAIGVLLVAGQQAQATRLIFENEAGAGAISPTYGDNVTTSPQGGYSYGLEGGATANVTVDYVGNPLPWSTGYGDLTHVVYDGNDATNLEVRLIAEPGYLVALHSFEMAGYLGDFENVPVTVTDGNGAPLFSYTGHIEGEGSTPDPQGDGNVHTDFDFAVPLVAPEIRISFDDPAAFAEYIGIDNIVFSQQAVPEPTAAGALLVGGAAAMLKRGRRG